MAPFGFGIVGTGMIAGVIAEAIGKAKKAKLAAVSSRRMENAQNFVAKFPGAAAVEGIDALLARPDVDAVYIATPTVAKEKIALAAIAAGKHVLVDKPFDGRASAVRMTEAATAKGLVFMDATHFVHNPRTAAIQQSLARADRLAPLAAHLFLFSVRRLHTTSASIRSKSRPARWATWPGIRCGPWSNICGRKEKSPRPWPCPSGHAVTGAVMRVSGLIAFESGEVSTFDVGWTAGTIIQDLLLLGTTGVIGMDDFVLDWTQRLRLPPFRNPGRLYPSHRHGNAGRRHVRPSTGGDSARGGDDRGFCRSGTRRQPGRAGGLCRGIAQDAGVFGCTVERDEGLSEPRRAKHAISPR